MKAGDRLRLSTLRMLVAAVKQKEIDSRTTLDDDGVFQYRVRVIDQRDQYRYELSEQFSVPNVSSLYIPDHYLDLETSYYTKFIDHGDSIIFRPGLYPGNHRLFNKDVVITSTSGPIITILIGVNNRESVISINRGKIENLGVQNGRGLVGGGVWAGGTSLVKNCFIKGEEYEKTNIIFNNLDSCRCLQFFK